MYTNHNEPPQKVFLVGLFCTLFTIQYTIMPQRDCREKLQGSFDTNETILRFAIFKQERKAYVKEFFYSVY